MCLLIASFSRRINNYYRSTKADWLASTQEAVRGSIFAAMKKLIFLGACLLALASQPVLAQTGGLSVVTVRISQGAGRVYVAISNGTGKAEVSEVETPNYTNKNIGPIADIFQQTVVRLSQQGYTLKGMSGGDVITTLVFVKDK